MASTKHLAAILLIVFFCVGVFAWSASTVSMNMHTGEANHTHSLCPIMGMSPLCVNVLDHISYWQLAFTAPLVEILMLLVLAFTLAQYGRWLFPRYTASPPFKIGLVSNEPTLFQYLLAHGILNPKIP